MVIRDLRSSAEKHQNSRRLCDITATWHQPEEGRRSLTRPTLSQLHSRWCSPLPSFWWRRSWRRCQWTGSLSRRWKPTYGRHRQHPVTSVSASDSHSSPANHVRRQRRVQDMDDFNIPAFQQQTSQEIMFKWLCNRLITLNLLLLLFL